MKKYLIYIFIAIVLIGSFIPVYAQTPPASNTDYKFLAPLPCKQGEQGCVQDAGGNWVLKSFDPAQPRNLGVYLNIMLKIIIGLAAVLSVIMIVVGGIEYMTSELAHTKEAGKSRITHAILGLLLALGAYALLYTINPDLLKSEINVPSPTEGICDPYEGYNQPDCISAGGRWTPAP